jgi:hypothetical protein
MNRNFVSVANHLFLLCCIHLVRLTQAASFLNPSFLGNKNTVSEYFFHNHRQLPRHKKYHCLKALSEKYFENDLVSARIDESIRLYVVRPDATITPLCTHADDNPTDLYVDPRSKDGIDIDDENIIKYYGEGWYSQRVVPSLGGGPGYGAEADDVWSVEEQVIEQLTTDLVEVPTLDLGIAHGEKARGGAI